MTTINLFSLQLLQTAINHNITNQENTTNIINKWQSTTTRIKFDLIDIHNGRNIKMLIFTQRFTTPSNKTPSSEKVTAPTVNNNIYLLSISIKLFMYYWKLLILCKILSLKVYTFDITNLVPKQSKNSFLCDKK